MVDDYQPVAWIEPARFGYWIEFGWENPNGYGLALTSEGLPTWRPTREMAENRATRFIIRQKRKLNRESKRTKITSNGV